MAPLIVTGLAVAIRSCMYKYVAICTCTSTYLAISFAVHQEHQIHTCRTPIAPFGSKTGNVGISRWKKRGEVGGKDRKKLVRYCMRAILMYDNKY